MFLQGMLLAGLAVLQIAVCLPVERAIEAVDLNYYCIHVESEEHKTDKSPVLLIHGLTGSISHWDGVLQVLAFRTGRKVCAVDLRNHGDSPWSDESNAAAMVEDIKLFLEKQKIEKVNVIGHSLGGKVGVHLALNNPEKVNSLVVEDMRPNGVSDGGLKLVKYYAQILQDAIESVPEGVSEEEAKKSLTDFLNKKMQEVGSNQTVDKTVDYLKIRLVNNKWQWGMNWNALKKFLDSDELLTESEGVYTGPTLFIYGTKSIFDVGSDRENILKLFPNAKLVPVQGADHMIHGLFKEFEDEVIKLLNDLTM